MAACTRLSRGIIIKWPKYPPESPFRLEIVLLFVDNCRTLIELANLETVSSANYGPIDVHIEVGECIINGQQKLSCDWTWI